MQITFDTTQLSELDYRVLAVLAGVATAPAAEADKATEPKPAAEEKPAAKPKAKPKPAAKPKPEPEPEPEPMAEEELEEEVEEEPADEAEDTEEEISDEDLLDLAVKKATEMVASGDAAAVREALDTAGAGRVRELNKDNVREFFKALP